MFRSLDTVSKEYFYQILLGRDTGARARIKGLWAFLFLSGIFLVFSSVMSGNSTPFVAYSYNCNRVFVILFGIQAFFCLFFSMPGVAGKLQKMYWVFVYFHYVCLQFCLWNFSAAVMGVSGLPSGFFLLVLCAIFGGLVLNVYILRRAVKRIPLGYYKENGTRIFDDKSGRIKKYGAIISVVALNIFILLFIIFKITVRLVQVSNIFILIFILFLSTLILLVMSLVSYFPILQIYCVDRFPVDEFTAKKVKKDKKMDQE